MSSSKRLMEWIDEEERVIVEEVVKLSEEDNTYAYIHTRSSEFPFESQD